MDLDSARAEFPELAGTTFLDAACVSLVPERARRAIADLMAAMSPCRHADATAYHIALDETRGPALREVARLINAREDDVALVESTSHGLNVVARGLELRAGDEIVMPELEFMGAAVPWVPLCERAGARIVLVPADGGRVTAEQLIERCGDRTRAVCVSTVQWSSGYRIDLDALAGYTRSRGILLVADAIHQLGAHRIDVRSTPVDALVAGGHKWLNAPFGRGLLYLAPEARARLDPPCWSYLNLQPPAGGWGAYFATPEILPVADYQFVDTAQRYELGGTTNYLGNVGLGAAVGLVNELGHDAIERHIGALRDRLRDGLRERGLRVVSPDEPGASAGITTFSAGTPDDDHRVLRELSRRRIQVSVRYTAGVGGVRVSTHFFNDADDVDALLAAL